MSHRRLAVHATGPRLLLALAWMIGHLVGGWPAAGADEPAGEPRTPEFQPGDISIGEPIPLPFTEPATDAAASDEPAEMPVEPAVAPPPRVAEPAAPPDASLPGNGWLGFAVVESAEAGRWEIDTVAAGGPAEAAGLRPGDEVRAIDGLPLKSSDDVSQAMTAVAPGQQVKLAIARGEQVGDVVVIATARRRAVSAWGAAAAMPSPGNLPPPGGPPATSPATAAIPAPPAAVAAPPPTDPPAATPAPTPGLLARTAAGGRTALGVRTVPVDEAVQSRFNLPQPRGAYVIGVVSDLPASKAGVPPGSVIVSLDDRPVESPAQLTRLVTAGPLGRPVPLEYVLPGGSPQRAEVVLQTLERPLEEALVGPSTTPAATGTPRLERQPDQPRPAATTTTRRPVTPFDAGAVSAMQDEIRWLRARLDALEERLDGRRR